MSIFVDSISLRCKFQNKTEIQYRDNLNSSHYDSSILRNTHKTTHMMVQKVIPYRKFVWNIVAVMYFSIFVLRYFTPA